MPYVLSAALVLILGEKRQAHIGLGDLCPPPTSATATSASPGRPDQWPRSAVHAPGLRSLRLCGGVPAVVCELVGGL